MPVSKWVYQFPFDSSWLELSNHVTKFMTARQCAGALCPQPHEFIVNNPTRLCHLFFRWGHWRSWTWTHTTQLTWTLDTELYSILPLSPQCLGALGQECSRSSGCVKRLSASLWRMTDGSQRAVLMTHGDSPPSCKAWGVGLWNLKERLVE